MWVKNWQKTSSIEEELVAKNWLEKGEQVVKYTIMLDSLILVYIHLMTMLTELIKGSAKSGTKVFE